MKCTKCGKTANGRNPLSGEPRCAGAVCSQTARITRRGAQYIVTYLAEELERGNDIDAQMLLDAADEYNAQREAL